MSPPDREATTRGFVEVVESLDTEDSVDMAALVVGFSYVICKLYNLNLLEE